ncbi:MAG: radical SAM protein [Deltaproteobacteria bacterium]|nr:radical SAM protein [Deltaproteobacteria bacterium]
MIITFIDPPPSKDSRIPERVFGCTYGLYAMPNIFLLTAAAVLEQRGHRVRYINTPLKKWGEHKFVAFLEHDTSDVYIIYAVNLSYDTDMNAVSRIKRQKPRAKIVFIGPAPTSHDSKYIIAPDIFCVRGEPDFALADLIDHINTPEKAANVSYLRAGKVVANPATEPIKDLDTIPFPARHLIDDGGYFNPKFKTPVKRFTVVLTSRGCPYPCSFCVPNSLSFATEIEYKKTHNKKPPYRVRSPQNVLKELRTLKKSGFTHISFIDDEFTINKKRVLEICHGLEGLNLSWGCLARADSLDEALVHQMAKAGCEYVDIGVESLDQSILDDIKKNIRVETIQSATQLLKKEGIFAKLNILLGASERETIETIRKTIDGVIALKPDSIMFSLCNPFPGTDYYTLSKEKGYFVKGDYYPIDVQKETTISLPHISKEQMEKEIRRANRRFFLSPSFIANNIYRLRSPLGLIKSLSALYKKIF